MRLYKVSATIHKGVESAPVRSVRWFGTQGDCATRRKELNTKHGVARDAIKTDEVEVPTTKKELLEWLNANAV